MSDQLTLFSSYSHKQFSIRDSLELKIRQRDDGNIIFISDRFNGRLGDNLDRWIEESIGAADVLFTILTKESLKSRWVLMEIVVARQLNRRIVALVAPDSAGNGVDISEWLRDQIIIPFDATQPLQSGECDRIASELLDKLQLIAQERRHNTRTRRTLGSILNEFAAIRHLVSSGDGFHHSFRAEQVALVVKEAKSEIQKLSGGDYQQNLSLSQAFVIRAKPIFACASATYATSVDFVSTFWEEEAGGLAPEYLAAQTGQVKRLFVFSSPRQATRHLNILKAHNDQYGGNPGGAVLMTSANSYHKFMLNKIRTAGEGESLLKGDFALLKYENSGAESFYEARLNESRLECRELPSRLSREHAAFLGELDRLSKILPEGQCDSGTSILRWHPEFAEESTHGRNSWKSALERMFEGELGNNANSIRDRDVFHLVFFSRQIAAADLANRASVLEAGRRLRESISRGVDRLISLKTKDRSRKLVKDLWFGDFNEGLRRLNVTDGRFSGKINTGGLFVDNFPYVLIMRFEHRSDLQEYYESRVHSEIRQEIFEACDPSLATLFGLAKSADNAQLRAELYQAIEASASRFVVRADYVEHEDIQWIVDNEKRIEFSRLI